MGNKFPKSYDEFEKAFQRKEKNLTNKEQFIEILREKGMINEVKGKNGRDFNNDEVLMAIFKDKLQLKNSKTGYHKKILWKSGNEVIEDCKNNIEESTSKTFYVTFDPDHPPNRIIIGDQNVGNLEKSNR